MNGRHLRWLLHTTWVGMRDWERFLLLVLLVRAIISAVAPDPRGLAAIWNLGLLLLCVLAVMISIIRRLLHDAALLALPTGKTPIQTLWRLAWWLLPVTMLAGTVMHPATGWTSSAVTVAVWLFALGETRIYGSATLTLFLCVALAPTLYRWPWLAAVLAGLGVCNLLRHAYSEHGALQPPATETEAGKERPEPLVCWRDAPDSWSRILRATGCSVIRPADFVLPIALAILAPVVIVLLPDDPGQLPRDMLILLVSGIAPALFVGERPCFTQLVETLRLQRERQWLHTVPGIPSQIAQRADLRQQFWAIALLPALTGLTLQIAITLLIGLPDGMHVWPLVLILLLLATRFQDARLTGISDDPHRYQGEIEVAIPVLALLSLLWGVTLSLGYDIPVMMVTLALLLIEFVFWWRRNPRGYPLSLPPDAHRNR